MVGELHGKAALVTGAATGIGRATALALAEAGANVLVHCSRSREDADIVAKLVRDLGRQAHVMQADLSDRAQVTRLAEEAADHWGHLDVLVNNAATIEAPRDVRTQGADLAAGLAEWDRVVEVNLRAPYELTARIGKRMLERRAGSIVNVASVAGMYALTDAPLYSMTKAALLHFTRQAAQAFAPHVRVNAVAPGWTETGFNSGLILQPEFQKQIVKTIPMRRLASPEEIAEGIVWLVKAAPYVTGHALTLDGGMVSELR